MENKYNRAVEKLVRLSDLVLINGFFIAVYYLFGDTSMSELTALKCFIILNGAYAAATIFTKSHLGIYSTTMAQQIESASKFILFYTLFVSVGLLIINVLQVSFLEMFGWFLVGSTIFVGWRIMFRFILKSSRRLWYKYSRIIVVGYGNAGREFYRSLQKKDYGYKALRYLDLENPDSVPTIQRFVKTNKIDELIFIHDSGVKDDKIPELIYFAEKNMVRFYLVPDIQNYFNRRLKLTFIDETPMLSLREEPLRLFWNRITKRTFDFIFSSLVLILIFPIVFIIFGTIIKLGSKGPVFFKQKRTGLNGRDFVCYKFRSMRQNKDADKVQAKAGDMRITRVGAFMRKTNIDELPQFINVFINDMSIVGPRPHMLSHTEQYSALIDEYMVRHLVKPGITGLAQVSGYRGETETVDKMEARVKADIQYLENWSIWLDIKIILLTVYNVFRGDPNAR